MVSSLFNNFSLLRYSIRAPLTQNQNVCFLQLNHLSTSSKGTSKFLGKDEDKKMYTMNYLVTTLGFSPERAQISCKLITFETPKKPDSVISFLCNHGFTKTQISKMVSMLPTILVSNPEKILLPKIEFFRSVGFSKTDVASIMSASPAIFHRSLENQLTPSVHYFKGLFQSLEGMVVSLKRYRNNMMSQDLETTFIPNIDYLKELGVPQWNIVQLLQLQPRTLSMNHAKFRKIVNDVKEIGLNPVNFIFLWGVHAFVCMSEEKWEMKMQVYKGWGFSPEEILKTFKKHPHFMIHSAEKITDTMHYLVNKMGFKPSLVIERPQLLCLSLQKRIIPRCSVYQILSDKDLIPQNFSIKTFLECPEKKFLRQFVVPFEAQVPELLISYNKFSPCLT